MVHTKSSRIEIRTSQEAKSLIEKAASLTGETISSYILSRSIDSARHDVERMETIVLNNQERETFLTLLAEPPAPNQALKDLFQ